MTHLHQRLQRLEAQAWEVEGRRLAQMTEAALDAEIVRVEAHYGVSIQDYECFVETLSASELEALCTADRATMRRFAARLSALEERPRMSLPRLGARLTWLEHDAHRVRGWRTCRVVGPAPGRGEYRDGLGASQRPGAMYACEQTLTLANVPGVTDCRP